MAVCGTGNGSELAMIQLHQQELLRMAAVLVAVIVLMVHLALVHKRAAMMVA